MNDMKKYAILVLSCDAYADLWEPFFSQFEAYWPRCPFPVYLGTNTKRFRHKGVRTILSGSCADWSSDLLAILESIKEKYVFLWVEDFFPVDNVDSALFLRAFQFMQKSNANHMHMSDFIKPDGYDHDSLFGYYDKGTPYRINAPGFWSVRHLKTLLIPGENPWKFEIMGSYRASYYDGYFCIKKPLFRFIRIVEKGRIRRGAYEYCMKNRIRLDTRTRQVDTSYQKLKSDIKEFVFNAICRIPWRIRVTIMDTMRRLLVSY